VLKLSCPNGFSERSVSFAVGFSRKGAKIAKEERMSAPLGYSLPLCEKYFF
jgi:hypothetical protein